MNYLFITSDNYHDLRYRIYQSGTRKHLPLNTLWEQFKAVPHLSENYSPDHDPDEIEYLVACFHFTGSIQLIKETETCDSCESVISETYQDNQENWNNAIIDHGDKTNRK